MRILTVALFILPLLSMAQSHLEQSHAAVFFKGALSNEGRSEVLRQCGARQEAVEFLVNMPVAFIAEGGVSKDALIAHDAVVHIAPVYKDDRGRFITYRNTFFVKVYDGNDETEVYQLADRHGLKVLRPDPLMPSVMKLETSKTGITAVDAVEIFRSSGRFSIVSLNLLHTVADCSVNDPLFARQWNITNTGAGIQGNGTPGADMDVEAAWAITTGNPDIKIAIMDSGVDTLHPDLLGKLLPGFDAMAHPDSAGTGGFPTPTYSQDGHGTACAGIAAATGDNSIGIAGVCRDCSIIPIRVFAYENIFGQIQPLSDTESFVRGINWQWQVANADVSSNSWGVPDFLLAFFPGGDLLVNDAIDAATEQGRDGKGLPMLFSSGNDGVTDSIPIWPARYHRTIAVNSTSMCDERKSPASCDGENWAGNWGNHLDCGAPGVRIPTTDMTGGNGYNNTAYYNSFNGTSAACPNAAGAMALLLSAYPELSRHNATRHLLSSAELVGGYDYSYWKEFGNWSNELGYGRLNAHLALQSAASVGVDDASAPARPLVMTFPDHLVIRLATDLQVQWALMDMSGRMVSSGAATGQILLPSAQLPHAIYALRIADGNKITVVKLLMGR
jgi:subtilisin family serine protease